MKMQNRVHDSVAQPTNVGIFQDFSQAWLACIDHVLENGHEVMDGEARLREALNVSVSAYCCSVSEFLAVGANKDRLQLMLRKYRSQVVLPAYRMSYGRLFRNHGGVNQVQWMIDRLKGNPDSKSATIGFHVPGDCELSCISLLDCKIRYGTLHVTAVFRSQNVYASQPGNVCALYDVQQEIADNLGIPAGSLTLHIISAHIYESDWSAAHEIVSPKCDYEAIKSSDQYYGSRTGRRNDTP